MDSTFGFNLEIFVLSRATDLSVVGRESSGLMGNRYEYGLVSSRLGALIRCR